MKQSFSIFFLAFAVLVTGLANAATQRDPSKYLFEQTLGDLGDDLEEAKSQGKKGVLIFFEQDECPFCHRMKTTILNQVEVQEYFKKHFLILSIDIESQDDLVDFQGNETTQKKYFQKIANFRGATPVFAFYDLSGKLVTRYTGATSGADEFMWLGEYFINKVYTKMRFSKYKRKKRKEARKAR